MAKYSAVILLVAVAVCWSSASAKPRHNAAQSELINAFSEWSIEGTKDLPEPYKSKLTAKLHDVKRKHWNDMSEFMTHLQSILEEVVRDVGNDIIKKKNEFDSGSNEFSESDEAHLKKFYADTVVAAFPFWTVKSALRKKLDIALEQSNGSLEEFKKEADHIIKKLTGMRFD